jgi:hypothetical protein
VSYLYRTLLFLDYENNAGVRSRAKFNKLVQSYERLGEDREVNVIILLPEWPIEPSVRKGTIERYGKLSEIHANEKFRSKLNIEMSRTVNIKD